jgi:hypothetical protein
VSPSIIAEISTRYSRPVWRLCHGLKSLTAWTESLGGELARRCRRRRARRREATRPGDGRTAQKALCHRPDSAPESAGERVITRRIPTARINDRAHAGLARYKDARSAAREPMDGDPPSIVVAGDLGPEPGRSPTCLTTGSLYRRPRPLRN